MTAFSDLTTEVVFVARFSVVLVVLAAVVAAAVVVFFLLSHILALHAAAAVPVIPAFPVGLWRPSARPGGMRVSD